MDKSYLLTLTLTFCNLFSFDFHDFDVFQHQIGFEEMNLKIKKYLEKDPEIKTFYRLTPDALYVGDIESERIDYVLTLSHTETISSLPQRIRGLQGKKIAIDPGHVGGVFAELEKRYIHIPAQLSRDGSPICLYEGDLTLLTALKLKKLLTAEGAEVFITRSSLGKGALEEDFFAWMQRHLDLIKDEASLSTVFRKYYNREDLKKRAEKINAFAPDITVCIHYNEHLSDGETFLTDSNYTLMFIPGAFSAGELKEAKDRYEFLRLIVTDNIEESFKLSEYILQACSQDLQIPVISQEEANPHVESVSLLQSPGIYSRNLALTRLVHSPICYGETLVQNNKEEVYKLSSPCSTRLEQVARAYFQGIKQYFESSSF